MAKPDYTAAEQTAGYSGTPLYKKLGIKSGFNIRLVNQPEYYLSLFKDLPEEINFNTDHLSKKDLIHVFIRSAADYTGTLPSLKNEIKPDGIIWVSWLKKSSKLVTDVNEGLVRNFAIQTGLVDIKVCAIDQFWSALKLVIPIKSRNSNQL